MTRHQKTTPRNRILDHQTSKVSTKILSQSHIDVELSEQETIEKEKNKILIELIFQFSECLLTKNTKNLTDLLSDTGKFYILNILGSEIKVGKQQYIYWLQSKLHHFSVNKIEYGEEIGNQTKSFFVVYNEGTFPWQEPNHPETPIAGLMFEIENGKISVIDYVSDIINVSKTSNNW